MSQAAPITSREDHVLRAIVFALAVLAQLLLPAVMLRAEALAGDLCVMQGSDRGTQQGTAHDRQCTQCRLHECSSVAPPPVNSVVVLPSQLKQTPHAAPALAAAISARRTQPPPTGPPIF